MKQIKFPYAASSNDSYELFTAIITDFNKKIVADDSDFVEVLLTVNTAHGDDLVLQFDCEPIVADYYLQMYEQKQPVNMSRMTTSHLIYTPGITEE